MGSHPTREDTNGSIGSILQYILHQGHLSATIHFDQPHCPVSCNLQQVVQMCVSPLRLQEQQYPRAPHEVKNGKIICVRLPRPP